MGSSAIHHGFSQAAARAPGAPAVSFRGGVTAYAELSCRVDDVAAALRQNGGCGGEIVGLWLPPGVDYVAALLGVNKSGAAFLPFALDPPQHRLAAMLDTGRPTQIITNGDHRDRLVRTLAELGYTVPVLAMDAIGTAGRASADEPEPGNLCYLLFTSGSTGTPKAVAGTGAGLQHFIDWEIEEFGLDAACRISLLAAPTFDVSLRDILVPLLAGGRLCIPEPATRAQPRALIDWLAAEGVTQVHCVPSLFRLLLGELETRGGNALPDLQRVLLAGEPLYARDVRRWRRTMGERAEIVNLYGPAETTLAKAFYRVRDVPDTENGIVPIGRAIADTELLIVRDGVPCDVHQIGEIHIRTRFASKGYYGDPLSTAEKFKPLAQSADPDDIIYCTGDQGRFRADRVVEFIGRLDNQVKVNGIRIELGDVESNLLRHPRIREAVATAHRDGDEESRLAVYFTADGNPSPGELREHLAHYLPANMQPSLFVQLESLPLNLHGKVDRKALHSPTNVLCEDGALAAPEGEVETALAGIWGQVLGLRQAAVDRTFVDMGGDSLKAIRALGEMYKAFDVEVSLRVFFEQGTIRELARWLRDEAGVNQERSPEV